MDRYPPLPPDMDTTMNDLIEYNGSAVDPLVVIEDMTRVLLHERFNANAKYRNLIAELRGLQPPWNGWAPHAKDSDLHQYENGMLAGWDMLQDEMLSVLDRYDTEADR